MANTQTLITKARPRSIKQFVIPAMLVLIVVPFIAINDFFPFYRFGMFAEPVRHAVQTEVFDVYYIGPNNQQQKLDIMALGFPDNNFDYLLRNYYYRGEGKLLLRYVHQLAPQLKAKEWQLWHITSDEGSTNKTANKAAIFRPGI